ncbi:DUF7007 domain-containing protein [Novosphingobium gossypii]|uniref:DUF7007 domain-containing protein n=1 Tax=Novosphingobium gossypii TaxID=1604774 RepID=UPI003D1D1F0D
MPQFFPSPRPATSPWGLVAQADQLLPGIWSVATPSHGGLILSAARQAAMPAALALEEAAYEKHVAWGRVVLAFEQEFRDRAVYAPSHIQVARDTVRCWHTSAYSAFTGESVPVNESHVLKRRAAYLSAIGEVGVTAAWGDWASWVPAAKVGVVGRCIEAVDHLGHITYAGPEYYALVDAARYDERGEAATFAGLVAQQIERPAELAR